MEITPELITQYGLMNKISTGNAYLDVIFCMLVPLLLKHLVPILAGLRKKLWPNRVATKFSRNIEFTQRASYYWYRSDDQPSNSILQRAILNMVNQHVRTLRELPDADLVIKKKPADEEVEDFTSDDSSGGSDDGSDYSSDDGSDHKHAYSFNLVPPVDQWVKLDNGVSFMREEKTVNEYKHKSTKITYTLESSHKDGSERISAFVADALEVYRKQQSARVDPARYLYMPVLSGWREPPAEGEESKPSALYKRYKLSDEKTFASFFHPDKDPIMRLVDQFMSKGGKFAVPGYPHKLGFLLYGPPGTGKTSLIKALAQYTKRSIISVPLSKISTNQELMDIVFDNKLTIQNSSDKTISLPFDKTIFVMEDVDAASSVVQRRTQAPASCTPASAAATQAEVMALAERIANAKLAAAKAATPCSRSAASRDTASSKDGDEPADQDVDKGEEGAPGRIGSSSGTRRCGGNVTATTGTGSIGWETGVEFGPSLPMAAFRNGKGLFKGDDELNLAGLLNVLDGVVDTPNRIIIMTTNHPDKLDPALIRPGRINKKIFMGRLLVGEALSMMRHYFGPISAADEAAMRKIFVDEQLSPADLEAMCAEHGTPAELVAAVAERLSEGDEVFKQC